MSLETIGPVFVGDGKTIDKKSYIYTDAKHIEIIDLEKMYNLLQKMGMRLTTKSIYCQETEIILKSGLQNIMYHKKKLIRV